MANSRTDDNMPSEDDVPPGWKYVCEVKKNGKIVKYYANVLGQKFYNKPDLTRNIAYSKKKGYSIYAPDFQPPPPGRHRFIRKLNDAAARNKKEHHASSNYETFINSDCKTEASSTNEVVSHNDFECASALIDLSLEGEDALRRATNLLPIPGSRPTWMEQGASIEPSRVSRRLAGLEPELKHDFMINKPLEYVLRDKPSQQPSQARK